MLILFLSATVIACCASAMYHPLEKWSYFESIYFCFVAFATIGFGDYVVSQVSLVSRSSINVTLGRLSCSSRTNQVISFAGIGRYLRQCSFVPIRKLHVSGELSHLSWSNNFLFNFEGRRLLLHLQSFQRHLDCDQTVSQLGHPKIGLHVLFPGAQAQRAVSPQGSSLRYRTVNFMK